MDKYIGKKLEGRYEVLEVIGVGGMANVYKGHDIVEDKIVAIKILRDEFLSSDEFIRRFKNESKAIAVLSHPNIVKIFDVSFTDKYQFIVMEYVNGITLKEYISQQKKINWKETVHFTVETLRALQHAHDKGIVHRDVKPHNIMLLSDGTIKVMDFGIARFARSETRTITDKAIGSVHYISPEQARGDKTDEKTDIYSVGVMMFEMLTGELPFEADSAVSVAIKQISAKPRRPREINPNIPEGLEEIIMKAMQKDSAKRYHTASEMLRDIDEFKRNPDKIFEYKYSIDSRPTNYYDAVIKKSNIVKEQKRQESKMSVNKVQPNRNREEQDDDRKSAVIPIMTGVAMAFVLSALVFIAYIFVVKNPFQSVPEVPMPNLVGLPFEAAQNLRDCQKMKIKIVDQQWTTEYVEGVIYEQSPAPGRSVKETAHIEVKVSLGINKKTVPSLANTERNIAQAKLRSINIKYKEEEMFDDNVPSGYIVKTSPEYGTELSDEDIVTLYISKGPKVEKVKVPSLSGIPKSSAQILLEAEGLKLGEVKEDPSSKKDPGTVIEQSEPAGTELPKGSTVDITISPEIKTYGYNMSIVLPNIDRDIEVSIVVDGKKVTSKNLNPSQTRNVEHDFNLTKDSTVEILINGQQFKVFTFAEGSDGSFSHILQIDNTDQFN